jgi:hypoxanthine phosphoribosyltransferase
MEKRDAMEDNRLNLLISEDRIRARVAELGASIRADHGDRCVTCIGVLKGSFIFLADLARAIGGPVRVEFLGVSPYTGGLRSSGAVAITQDLRNPVENQDCIVVEDIVDTGRTLAYLLRLLQVRNPRSLKVCSLLDKPSNREVDVTVDYAGFEIPDEFVVGYGLDLGELYRNLPYIAVYSP